MKRMMGWRIACGVLVTVSVGGADRVAAQQTAQQGVESHGVADATRLDPDADEAQAVLSKLVSVDLKTVSVRQAVDAVAAQAGVRIVYRPEIFAGAVQSVTIRATRRPLREVMDQVLTGTMLQLRAAHGGRLVLVEREATDSVTAATVTGRVADSVSGNGIAGVAVTVQGTRLGALTDHHGDFTITGVAPGARTLTFKLLGYTPVSQTVRLQDQQQIMVRVLLQHTASLLTEVVTTATGVQRRVEVGNDITTINVDSVLKTMPVATLTDLIATRVPGAFVLPQSGLPGAPSKLRIRGISSINATSDPIVIVDGIRMYAAQFGQGQAPGNPNINANPTGQTGVDDRSANMAALNTGKVYFTPSPLDQIDPNSIETLEVLKGPSAVALYGTDAANGVIVITTRRGQAGPTRWSLSGSWGTEFLPGSWPANYYMWGHLPGSTVATQCTLPQSVSSVNRCIQDSLQVYQPMNNAATTMLGNGSRTMYRTDVQGGTHGLTYALSGSASNDIGLLRMADADLAALAARGVVPSESQRRPEASESQGLQARLESELSPKTRVSFTSLLDRTFTRGSPLQNALATAATLSPVNVVDDPSLGTGTGVLNAIPDWRARTTSRTVRTSNALNLSAQPLWDITTTATGGVDLSDRKDVSTLGSGQCYSGFSSGACSFVSDYYNTGQGTAMTTSVTLLAAKPLSFRSWLTIHATVGGNFVRTTTDDQIINASGLPVGATSGNGALTTTTSVDGDDRSTAGVYLETNIGIADRLYFPLAIRQDAGSGLGNTVRPKFPKLAFSYVLSDEPMFKRLPFSSQINTFRARLAYGQSGVQPAITAKLRTYLQRNVDFGSGTPTAVQTIASVGNSDLQPELTTETEGGFDTDLFDSRINITMTWYRKRTSNALINEPLAPSLGYTATATNLYASPTWQRNIGTIQNTGFEATLGFNVLRGKMAQWDMNFGLSHTANVLLKYAHTGASVTGGTERLGLGLPGSSIGSVDRRFVEGYPLYGVWVNPVTGWADLNHDGVITGDEVQVGDSSVFAGAPEPKVDLSMHHTITLFERFSIGATFDYQNGMTQLYQPRSTSFDNLSRAWNDPSTPLATQAFLVGALNRGASRVGSLVGYVQTVSTFRFNEFSFGYSVPPSLARKLVGGRQLRIALQGTNLGLWTNYRGVDPDVNSSMNEFNRDLNTLPTPRVWQLTVGIN